MWYGVACMVYTLVELQIMELHLLAAAAYTSTLAPLVQK
jgi:hypothetical protein